MTNDRDPRLQALFDAAPRASADSQFVAQAMANIDRERRKTIIGWLAAAILFVPVVWWLSEPVVSTLNFASQLMPKSIVEFETDFVAQAMAPINSVMGVAGLLFLGAWMFYRKVIR
jgi:hypothetical protein